MERAQVGELEELVLLSVGSLMEEAYAVSILKVIKEHTKRHLDVTAVHSVLRRLEKKGYISSQMGEATPVRGGRRKKYFTLTQAGRKVLDDIMQVRLTLYNQLPKLGLILPRL
ncbi:MAG: helix-turn-helix transcriptional regulator [Bacteroidota bacterium]